MKSFTKYSVFIVIMYILSGCSENFEVSKKDKNILLDINFVGLNGVVEEGLKQTIFYGNKAKEPTVKPVLDSYVFEGWYSDSSFTRRFDFSKKLEYDTNVYIKWETLNLVQFVTNGGNDVVLNQSIITGGVAKIPDTPKNKGYKFMGWFSDSSLKNLFEFTSIIKSNLTLYAKWKPIYTVSFVNIGGEEISPIIVDAGQKLEFLPQPKPREGLFLKGWFLEPTFDTEINLNNPITSDVKLYAMWTPVWVSIFKVSYDSNGGSEVNFQKVLRNRKITPPKNPVRNGYKFLGWSTKKSGEQPLFNFSENISEDITLYAKWKFVN